MIKKIILVSFMTSVLFAADSNEFESKLFDLNKVKSAEMKDFLPALESLSVAAAAVAKDYYEAKTCSDEFYNKVAVKDIQEFVSENQVFPALLSLKTTDNEKYAQIINDYKFINCGEGKIYNPEKYGFKRVEN